MGSCNCMQSKNEPTFEIYQEKPELHKSEAARECSPPELSLEKFSKDQIEAPLSLATSFPIEDTLRSHPSPSSLIKVQSLFRRYLSQQSYFSTPLGLPNPFPSLPEEVHLLLTPGSRQAYLSLLPFPSHFDSLASDSEQIQIQIQKKSKSKTTYTKLSDGSIYDGELNNIGHPEGKGVMFYSDGGISEGSWRNGLLHGQGRRISPQGDVYAGQWDSGKMQGQGKICYASSNSYEGGWINDLQDGLGVEVWGDGSKFEGSYKFGLKNGQGRFVWPDGSYYTGEFLNDQIHGAGRYCWPNREYVGEWKMSKMHGKGVFKWNDGKVYEGEYFNDQKHGWGVFTWPDGKKYEGFWAEGKQHGEGALMYKGKCKNGIWINGKLAKSNEDMIKG